jgi:hypothetical protein
VQEAQGKAMSAAKQIHKTGRNDSMRRMSTRLSSRRRGLAGAVASVFALALMGGTAQGAVYQQTGSFAVADPTSSSPYAIDIDQTNGRAYVANGSSEILVFDSAGNPLSPIATGGAGDWVGVGVDNSDGPNAGTIYAYSNNGGNRVIEAFTAAGTPVGTPFLVESNSDKGQFKVGPNGLIYFGHSAGFPNPISTLRVFQPDGTLQQTIDCSACPAPSEFSSAFNGVGVDPAGSIYSSNDRRAAVNEVQKVNVNASAGTFKLNLEGASTGGAGTGDLLSGSTTISNVTAASGAFSEGLLITGPGIPAGTTVAQIDPSKKTITLSAPATETLTGVPFSADIPFDGSNTTVDRALGGLPTIQSAGGVSVSKSGSVYTVTFSQTASSTTSTTSGVDFDQMTADTSSLTGTVEIETTAQGSLIPGRVVKFNAAGEDPSVLTTGHVHGLGVDQGTANVFVSRSAEKGTGWHVVGYDSTGNQFAEFGLGAIGGGVSEMVRPAAVAVNASTGAVYVGDKVNDKVWIYTPILPSATTDAATSVEQTAATLNGTVNPNEGGAIADCHFEWGTTTAYSGGTVPCASNPPDGNSAVPVEGSLSGLSANTTYHYRLIAENDSGTPAKGADQTFKTDPNAPSVTTGAAASITHVSAQLTGTVNPNGGATTCAFEYGTSESYGSEVPCKANPGSGSSTVSVGASLTGLEADTTYHYRLKATNSGGETKGAVDKTFTTLPDPPSATTEAAGSVSETGATLNGKVNANGDPADCHFEYGTSTSYGSTVSCSIDPVSGEASTSVSATLSGLAAGTTYHYRVVAENGGGKASGADMTFTTNAAPAPPAPTPPATTPPPPPAGDDGAAKRACIAKAMKAFKKAKKAAAKKKGKAKAKAMKAATKRKAKAIKQCNAA